MKTTPTTSPAEPAPRLTLRSIADELGVSAKTVSNAFTRPDQLSSQLREQVLRTAERMGYAGPDPLAASLRRGRVGAIGVAYANGLSYAFDDPVSVELLAGVSAAAEPAGIGLLLVPGSADPQRSVAAIGGALIDGLVVSSLADDDPLLTAAVARRLPLAVVDQPHPDRLAELGSTATPWVGIDDRAAARAAADHLLALGHRQLAVVCFGLTRHPHAGLVDETTQARTTYAVTRDRLAGYRDAALSVRLDWSRMPVFGGTDSTPHDGDIGATTVLTTIPRPTALLCLSDRIAEGALLAAGLGLTTIAQPTRRKGQLAGQALLRRLHNLEPSSRAETLPTRLVVRRTSGRAPSR